MAKFLTLAQLQKEFGITMRSLRELMQREIYEPVKSIADQAKAIADGVRRDADAGAFKGADGAPGRDGAPGQDGAPGEPGNPGFSPTVHVAEVTGGYRVTITDESGAHDFIVYDGADGQDGADGTDGVDGQDGQDGFSPSVAVSAFTGGHRVTITDAVGGHVFDVMDGQDGEDGLDGADGVSPIVAVSDITGGHRVTITDAVGDHVFNVMDGQSGGGAVASVNGKTGVVVLDAEDVGARADDWMPTAAQVGARADTWMPTAAQVGARADTWMPTASDVGAVSSVNGQTGAVVLDAEDVGARDAATPIGTSDIAGSAVSDIHTISFLPTDVWTQETKGASITKSASWVGANDTIIFDVLVSKTTSWGNYVKRVDAFSKLLGVTIADGSLTFSAREPFDIDLDVKCLRIKR